MKKKMERDDEDSSETSAPFFLNPASASNEPNRKLCSVSDQKPSYLG